MEGTGLLLHFRMIMMRLEEERVGDVSWLMLCVCCIVGLIGPYKECGLFKLLYVLYI